MLLAQPVRRELVFGLELFAADAVQARVSVLVDVPVVVDPLDELLDEAVVTLIGRAYEEVGSRSDARRQRPPVVFDEPVDERLRVDARLLGRTHVLGRLPVRPGQEDAPAAATAVM